ncbi:MAG: hypothetical protein KAU90_12130, partial [Sulfurovaceae bacterium]|nr:hypothetical protein [Sulfurovaceae bacterium]
MNSSVLIYNYPISFKRFAFRQVQNILDKKTWIDGLISLKGNAGFDVSFSNMSIDCSANLNNGDIDECTSKNKINCQQSLSAWKTATKFVSIGFENKSGAGSCTNADKILKVGHILDIKALSKPLGLTTTWLPSGEAGADATITGATSNYLDKAENNSSSTGFSIAIDSNAQLKNKGWYKLTSSFGLPFWGIKSTDLAVKNKDITKRDKTIVKKKGSLKLQDEYKELTSDTLEASYEWGTTGLGISLPVYYSAKNQDQESIFLGKTKSADLKVMSAKAGINYIQPNRTKISFGASADFDSLANLKINIDLNDPKSLKEIDSVLSQFGINNKPLETTIGLILNPLHQADKYVDKGMLLGMEELGVKS